MEGLSRVLHPHITDPDPTIVLRTNSIAYNGTLQFAQHMRQSISTIDDVADNARLIGTHFRPLLIDFSAIFPLPDAPFPDDYTQLTRAHHADDLHASRQRVGSFHKEQMNLDVLALWRTAMTPGYARRILASPPVLSLQLYTYSVLCGVATSEMFRIKCGCKC